MLFFVKLRVKTDRNWADSKVARLESRKGALAGERLVVQSVEQMEH
jgi:hypothetical protein